MNLKYELRQVTAAFIIIAAAALFPADSCAGLTGDVDGDGQVCLTDYNLVVAARNKKASGANDPRDIDKDGKITALDARKVMLLCTLPKCACNKAPVADAGLDAEYTLASGQTETAVTLDGSASRDPDGKVSSYVWTGDPDPKDVAKPIVLLGPRTYIFSLVVTDNRGRRSEPADVVITVKSPEPEQESPPQLTVSPDEFTVGEGETLEFSISSTDPDGDPVTLSASPKLNNASFVAVPGVSATGSFTFSPDYTQQGLYVIAFKARDYLGNTATATARITVLNVNRPPVITVPEQQSVDEGGLLTFSVNAADPDGDPVNLSAGALPENAIFIPATGTLAFTPDFEQFGSYAITCSADDGAAQDTDTVDVFVSDVQGGGGGGELVLSVNPVESPTLFTTTGITGTVNSDGAASPASLSSALITGVTPTSGRLGETLSVTLTGPASGDFATHFAGGLSSADFGEDITVNSISVTGPNRAEVNLTIDSDAEIGARQVLITTEHESAFSMLAFNVTRGTTRVTGVLVDPATGLPISGALVSVQGTGMTVTTGADGSFLLTGVPTGSQTLIVNAADHEVVTLAIDAMVGGTTNLDTIETRTTVYDPAAPPGASLHSVIGRGVGSLTGDITVEEAEQVITDTLIFLGGNEVGVLDPYGNQLNPAVTDTGKFSLKHSGVTLYAERMAMGDTMSLMELFYDMSFAFEWTGGPPSFVQFLGGMQALVNTAWSDPNSLNAGVPLVLFNYGKSLTPDPPVLSADTRINKFQGYLAISGFMTALYNHRDEWIADAGEWPPKSYQAFLRMGGNMLSDVLSPGAAFAADPPGQYTTTWEELIASFGKHPTGPKYSTTTGAVTTLPDFEEILKKYYVEQSEDSIDNIRNLLLEKFPGQAAVLNQIFNQNPYDVKLALDTLISVSSADVGLRGILDNITFRNGSGTPSKENIAAYRDVEIGGAFEFYYGFGLTPTHVLNVLQKSWAPNPPYIYMSRESTREIGLSGSGMVVPSAKIVFHKSGDDNGPGKNPSDVTFLYRLWRIEDGTKEIPQTDGTKKIAKYDLKLVGYGELDGSSEILCPKTEVDAGGKATGKFVFDIPVPPAGMNQYRIDCIRFKGDKTRLGSVSHTEFTAVLKPWLTGYLDEPGTIASPVGGLDRVKLNPGEGFLRENKYEISAMSNATSVYIGGGAGGFAAFGRVDLAADYKDNSQIYISIPGYRTTDEEFGERGTGSIFRYDASTGGLTEYSRPGFMTPGQIGLAIDKSDNLYTDNAASDTAYGGRIFKYPWTYTPPPEKLFVGSVNYYSKMLLRANPTAVQAMVIANNEKIEGAVPDAEGEPLIVADALTNELKKIQVQAAELGSPWDPWHIVGQRWAWNDDTTTPTPADSDRLNFDALTAMSFNRTKTMLYITQGPYVVQTGGGVNSSSSITRNGTLFVSTSGCDVCDAAGEEFLFVSDKAGGKIYRIPVADIPIDIPTDAGQRERLLNGYTFMSGLNNPGQIRITDDGNAMVIVDSTGLRYQLFGFTGRALDSGNNPLVGAVVTVSTPAGLMSTTTDGEGYYHFTDDGTYTKFTGQAATIANISHASGSSSERITLAGKCNANLKPAPCVVITEPADGAVTNATTITVRGSIFPKDVDYTDIGGQLEVNGTQYPLSFTGNHNNFVVSGVPLHRGDNQLVVHVGPLGAYDAGGSLVTTVESTAGGIETQAVAGVALDANGDPLSGAKVEIYINGVLEAETNADSCGYYNEELLPLGTVSVTIVE